jgi:hypothetical protein
MNIFWDLDDGEALKLKLLKNISKDWPFVIQQVTRLPVSNRSMLHCKEQYRTKLKEGIVVCKMFIISFQ